MYPPTQGSEMRIKCTAGFCDFFIKNIALLLYAPIFSLGVLLTSSNNVYAGTEPNSSTDNEINLTIDAAQIPESDEPAEVNANKSKLNEFNSSEYNTGEFNPREFDDIEANKSYWIP